MFPEGGQTRKYFFLAIFPEVGQNQETPETMFLSYVSQCGQILNSTTKTVIWETKSNFGILEIKFCFHYMTYRTDLTSVGKALNL
jgi:hypothetical protein